MTIWPPPTAPDVQPRSYGEMTDEQRLDAAYAVDATYAGLCELRERYLQRVRDGVTVENPLLRASLDSVCELANRDIQRVLAAVNERAEWARRETAAE